MYFRECLCEVDSLPARHRIAGRRALGMLKLRSRGLTGRQRAANMEAGLRSCEFDYALPASPVSGARRFFCYVMAVSSSSWMWTMKSVLS